MAKEAKKNADKAISQSGGRSGGSKWSPLGILTPTGALGADVGSASSAEERERKFDGRSSCEASFASIHKEVEAPGKETKYENALDDILDPPTPPNLIPQIIEEGFVQSPEKALKNVVILTKSLPTWLAAADSWGSQHLYLYCAREWAWYRDNLEITTPLSVHPMVAGFARAPWMKEKQNTILLIQGSSTFCKKVIRIHRK